MIFRTYNDMNLRYINMTRTNHFIPNIQHVLNTEIINNSYKIFIFFDDDDAHVISEPQIRFTEPLIN